MVVVFDCSSFPERTESDLVDFSIVVCFNLLDSGSCEKLGLPAAFLARASRMWFSRNCCAAVIRGDGFGIIASKKAPNVFAKTFQKKKTCVVLEFTRPINKHHPQFLQEIRLSSQRNQSPILNLIADNEILNEKVCHGQKRLKKYFPA
jgi:hypothetical protein